MASPQAAELHALLEALERRLRQEHWALSRKLTDAGVRLLKDANSVAGLTLARQRRPEKGRVPRRSRIEAESWQGVDRELFERLRALRLEIARSRNVPPYVIFHDTTLREMARARPATVAALRHIYGVGERKAAELGERFVTVILEHDRSHAR